MSKKEHLYLQYDAIINEIEFYKKEMTVEKNIKKIIELLEQKDKITKEITIANRGF